MLASMSFHPPSPNVSLECPLMLLMGRNQSSTKASGVRAGN